MVLIILEISIILATNYLLGLLDAEGILQKPDFDSRTTVGEPG